MKILTAPLDEVLRIYGELVECYHHKNSWGGDRAEIYAYRLQRYSPYLEGNNKESEYATQEREQRNSDAAHALIEICKQFAKDYHCRIRIYGGTAEQWLKEKAKTFDHRVHIEVIKKK
jgi:hypothetical protein